jgi:radical SAM family uncharacterized protein/radical SAM-linked protein
MIKSTAKIQVSDSPESITDQSWFSNIKRPSRYLGNEINAIIKTPAQIEVSIALAFTEVYEIGMSNLGLKILYNILNREEWLSAERAFCPWLDMEKELRSHKFILGTLESGRPLSQFDIVGFSLPHELSFTNVLNMLDLSGIPFLAEERSGEDPIVIAGGPACFNPEPVARFFDLIVVGDGEKIALEICRTVREAKKVGLTSKRETLSQLGRMDGIYIPSNFLVHYDHGGLIEAIEPTDPNCPVVKKAILADIDDYPFPDRQIVPFTELIHDRLAVEISRGCTRGCRFCQAGMIYRPVRERSPETILEKSENGLKYTGYEEISLLSLSSGDYSCIKPLLQALMDRQCEERTALSLPSLRVDSFSSSFLEQIKRVRKTGFTLAPEAGSERLRKIINKYLTQEDVLEMARVIYAAGWNLIKLYFMIGLPFEEPEDLQGIIQLAKEVAGLARRNGKRAKLNISISTFAPKSHTPFMWAPQIPLEESQRRIRLIQEGLKGSRVRVKWNEPELSWLEGIFSRGDRKLGDVLMEAFRLGARYDAWGEHFSKRIWEEAFNRAGLDPGFYLYRNRSLNEVLPWDHISSGVTKDYLMGEWEKARSGELTPDCRGKCQKCGVCDHEAVDPLLCDTWRSSSLVPEKPPAKPEALPIHGYRLTFAKLKDAKYLGHLELVRVFIRAFKRAGLRLVYSKGYHPMPKISFTSALQVGIESIQETVDIYFHEELDLFSLKERVNLELPLGIEVTFVEPLLPKGKKPRLRECQFLVTLDGIELKEKDLERFLDTDYVPVVKVGKKGDRKINMRSLVKSMSLVSSNEVMLRLNYGSGPQLGPLEIVEAVFFLRDLDVSQKRILKTSQVLE